MPSGDTGAVRVATDPRGNSIPTAVVGLKLPLHGHNGFEVKATIGLKSEENIVIERNAGQRRMLNAGVSTGVSCTLTSCDVVESKTATRRKRKRLRKAGFVGCGRGDADHCGPRAITRLDRKKKAPRLLRKDGRNQPASAAQWSGYRGFATNDEG